jgi:hypothetical protein
MVVLVALYLAGLEPLYMAKLAIWSWLSWQPSTWLGWLYGIVVLATLYMARLAILPYGCAGVPATST